MILAEALVRSHVDALLRKMPTRRPRSWAARITR
jgi:hypothetical protein